MTDAQWIAAIKTGLRENFDFFSTGSVTKARAYVDWLRAAIAATPQQTGSRDSHLSFDIEQLGKELDRATAWLAANDTTSAPTVTRASFENYR